MSDLFTIILPVFLVIGAGYLVTWRRLFSDSAVDGLMAYGQGIAVPVLLFSAMARLDIGAEFRAELLIPFYFGALCAFALGWAGGRYFFKRSPEDSVAIGFVAFFSNTLLLGIPITERAFGSGALSGNWAIISLHAPLLYMFGISLMEFTKARGGKLSVGRVALRALAGILRTPMLIGIFCGLVTNYLMKSGLVLPEGLWAAVDMIATSALPAALFGLGGILYRYRPEGDIGTIIFCCCCSLIVHPAVTFGLGSIIGLDTAGMRSAVVTAAMAPGVNAYLFANIYGSARRVAASAVLISTAFCIVSAWMWLKILP